MGLLESQAFPQPRRLSDIFDDPREGQVNMQGIADYYGERDRREKEWRIPEEDTYFKWKRREAPPEETAIGIAGGMKGNEDVYRQRVDENDRAAWLTGTGDLGAGTYESFGDFADYLGDTFGNGVLGFLGDDKERYYPSALDDFGPGMLGYGSQVAGTLLGGPWGMGLGLLGQGVDYDNRLDRYNAAIAKHAGIYDASNEDRGFWESLFSSGSLRDQSGDRWNAITQKGLLDYFSPNPASVNRSEDAGWVAPPAPLAVVDKSPIMHDWEAAYWRDQARREDERDSGYGDTDFGGGSMGTEGYAGGGTGGYGSPF